MRTWAGYDGKVSSSYLEKLHADWNRLPMLLLKCHLLVPSLALPPWSTVSPFSGAVSSTHKHLLPSMVHFPPITSEMLPSTKSELLVFNLSLVSALIECNCHSSSEMSASCMGEPDGVYVSHSRGLGLQKWVQLSHIPSVRYLQFLMGLYHPMHWVLIMWSHLQSIKYIKLFWT